MRRTIIPCVVAALAITGLHAQRAGSVGEWRYYGSDGGSTKYSPLDQVHARNVSDLKIAWRWTSPDTAFGKQNPDSRQGSYEDTPLMANGVFA